MKTVIIFIAIIYIAAVFHNNKQIADELTEYAQELQ